MYISVFSDDMLPNHRIKLKGSVEERLVKNINHFLRCWIKYR